MECTNGCGGVHWERCNVLSCNKPAPLCSWSLQRFVLSDSTFRVNSRWLKGCSVFVKWMLSQTWDIHARGTCNIYKHCCKKSQRDSLSSDAQNTSNPLIKWALTPQTHTPSTPPRIWSALEFNRNPLTARNPIPVVGERGLCPESYLWPKSPCQGSSVERKFVCYARGSLLSALLERRMCIFLPRWIMILFVSTMSHG